MSFPIDAFSWNALAVLLGICVLPLLGSGVFVWRMEKGRAGVLILLATIVLGAGVIGGSWWQMGSMRARITADAVEVEAGIYRRSVALADLQLEQAQILPRSGLGQRMALRSNGIGLPRLLAGWFTGSEGKVFAAIGSGEQCVVLPTRDGLTLILSPDEPERFLEALREQSAGPG